jgi:hypothetical protein
MCDVVRVAGEDDGAVGQSDDNDGGIDDVTCAGLAAQRTGSLRQLQADWDDLAAMQEPAQLNLSAGVTPRLCHDDGGDEEAASLFEGQMMDHPHPPVVVIDRQQRTGVVDVRNAHAAACPETSNA